MRPNQSATLLLARKAIRASLRDLPEGLVPVVGLSGGADSVVLAYAASLEGVTRAHIIDHGLQEVTEAVAVKTAAWAESLGLRTSITRIQVKNERASLSGGMECAARDARYAALLADPTHAVLLAHTQNDQAESVLMGFGRGSGSRSIQGMASTSQAGRILRPFLALNRSAIETICGEFDLSYWTDPHNSNPAYRRVRVRSELLPLMEEVLGGGVAEALARTAQSLQDDNEALDAIAEEKFSLATNDLEVLKPAIRRRVIRSILLRAGVDSGRLSSTHILAVEALITDWRGQKAIDVPGFAVMRSNGRIKLERN